MQCQKCKVILRVDKITVDEKTDDVTICYECPKCHDKTPKKVIKVN